MITTSPSITTLWRSMGWPVRLVVTLGIPAIITLMATDEPAQIAQAKATPSHAPGQTIAAITPRAELPSATMPAINDIAAMVERPLFASTRRPVAETFLEDEEWPEPEPILASVPSLKGTKIASDGVTGLFLNENNVQLVQATIGDQIGTWRVVDIGVDYAQLQSGDRIEMSQFLGSR